MSSRYWLLRMWRLPRPTCSRWSVTTCPTCRTTTTVARKASTTATAKKALPVCRHCPFSSFPSINLLPPFSFLFDSASAAAAAGFAGWVRAHGPKEPSLHAKPLKSALKKSGATGNGSSNNNSPSSSTPVPTPTQDHMEHSRGGAVSWQEPPPPPLPAR